MPYNRAHVRAFLGSTEIGLFESSLGETLQTHTPADLKRRIERTRKLRDKYRDLLRRQKLQTRTRTGSKGGPSGDANARTVEKATAFEQALKRFETEERRRAAADKQALAKSKSRKVAKAPAQPGAAAKKAAPAAKSAQGAGRKRKVAPPGLPASVVLRAALEKKHAAEATRSMGIERSSKAKRANIAAAPDSIRPTPPNVRAAVVASRMHEANLAPIQGHTSTQVRKAQAKRDKRG
ncbi:MAG: hypothetical protein ABIR94_20595 [Rubrivivax sp.]